jgi:hypothetical protein
MAKIPPKRLVPGSDLPCKDFWTVVKNRLRQNRRMTKVPPKLVTCRSAALCMYFLTAVKNHLHQKPEND